MGTTYNVSLVFNREVSTVQLSVYQEYVDQVLNEIDQSMSTYKSESDISRFNRAAVGSITNLKENTLNVIKLSAETNKFTLSYFDPTVGPLVDLWGFGAGSSDEFTVPGIQQIEEARGRVGFDKLEIVDAGLKKIADVELDLSAIAKGYAADRVAASLSRHGVTNFMVEIGGEVVTKGFNKRGTDWVLGIEAPDKNTRKVYTAVGISGLAMATSGDYRNFIKQGGLELSHTIDPVDGKPKKSRLASVTVIDSRCSIADAMATALMAMGDTMALEFAEKHQLSAFFIIRDNGKFISKSTSQFKKYIL